MLKRLFLVMLALVAVHAADATVTVPSVIGNNMVLQQQRDVCLWGKASPNASVTITASWGKTVTTQASVEGKWKIQIATPEAGGPYNIQFNDGTALTISNVMIGEVWFCAGQSNMECNMKGKAMDGANYVDFIDGYEKAIAEADVNVPIRVFMHARSATGTPQDEYTTSEFDGTSGSWTVNDANGISNASATAYFFAKYLQSQLHVPVGVIVTAYGGANIKPFMPRSATDEVKAQGDDINYDGVIFNSMISPLLPVSFKGMLWYQGEANIDAIANGKEYPGLYTKMFKALMNSYRKMFHNGDFPCYYVEIAPLNANNGLVRPDFRAEQALIPSAVDHVGMVSTSDVGYSGIHPPYKEPVGRRLAYWALNRDYGRTDVVCESPVFSKFEAVENGKAYAYFTNVQGGGLKSQGAFAGNFEMCGADGTFYSATGYVDSANNRVLVKSDRMCAIMPTAVRYCYKDFAAGTVFNGAGLPVIPFRSDH